MENNRSFIVIAVVVSLILMLIQLNMWIAMAIGYSEWLSETGLPDTESSYELYLEEGV